MDREYNTGLCKGQGMIPESIRLLEIWEPGVSAVQLRDKVRSEGLLSKATAQRMADIVTRVFAPRYLGIEGRPAIWLRKLLRLGMPVERLSQLLYLHTAREHLILYDFVREIYWPRYSAGAHYLLREDSIDFIKAAQATGRIKSRWTEGNNTRIGRYMMAALHDFKLLGGPEGDRRPILPFAPAQSTVIYLAHELHFSGINDDRLVTHSDWEIFGLTTADVITELRRASGAARFIVQAGDIVRISWGFQTMEECLDVVAE
ncbi:DUF1819 family protein [Opitutaceae bacterium TAV4]|nr:DUF1819 family protein [Opitutaceae bacterium TAV4]RRK00198.1 DUF1819 family protein [Opitutaceae bacterium TAV3]RRK01991.1 DUF1819 family protein [Opitutaceae bacterium TAV3]